MIFPHPLKLGTGKLKYNENPHVDLKQPKERVYIAHKHYL